MDLLITSGGDLDIRKTNHVSRVLELWVNLTLRGKRVGGLEIEFNHVANDLINHAYVMKHQ